jgi:hypothetical protein
MSTASKQFRAYASRWVASRVRLGVSAALANAGLRPESDESAEEGPRPLHNVDHYELLDEVLAQDFEVLRALAGR